MNSDRADICMEQGVVRPAVEARQLCVATPMSSNTDINAWKARERQLRDPASGTPKEGYCLALNLRHRALRFLLRREEVFF